MDMNSINSSNEPLVSVIVPSYNHSKYLAQCINSILQQTYKNIQLVVLDDGSSDNSPEILEMLNKEYGFQLVLKANEGLCATVNRGLIIAQGEFIVIFASDDIMPPNRISEQVQMMRQCPELDIIAGSVQCIDGDGLIGTLFNPKVLGEISFARMFQGNCIFAPSAMIRKSVYSKTGNYSPNYRMEDYYLWLKALSSGARVFNTNKIWALYRFDRSEFLRRMTVYYNGTLEILADYVDYPGYRSAVEKAELSYLVKTALADREKFESLYRQKKINLGLRVRIMLWLLALMPGALKECIIRHRFF